MLFPDNNLRIHCLFNYDFLAKEMIHSQESEKQLLTSNSNNYAANLKIWVACPGQIEREYGRGKQGEATWNVG